MTAYATAHVPSKLASPNTWISIRFKDSLLRLMLLGTFTFVGGFVSHFSKFLTSNLVSHHPMKAWNHIHHGK